MQIITGGKKAKLDLWVGGGCPRCPSLFLSLKPLVQQLTLRSGDTLLATTPCPMTPLLVGGRTLLAVGGIWAPSDIANDFVHQLLKYTWCVAQAEWHMTRRWKARLLGRMNAVSSCALGVSFTCQQPDLMYNLDLYRSAVRIRERSPHPVIALSTLSIRQPYLHLPCLAQRPPLFIVTPRSGAGEQIGGWSGDDPP